MLPRWGFTGSARNTVLLAAFLRQPIILMGHHKDVRNGLELLDDLARFINSLGPVLWSNMTELSRANYLWRMDQCILRLMPFGRKLKVDCPKGVNSLSVEGPLAETIPDWQAAVNGAPANRFRAGNRALLPKGADGVIHVE